MPDEGKPMRPIPSTAVSAAAALVLSVGGASAAFAADPSPNQSAAAAQLCTDLNRLRSDATALAGLNPASTTKDQVKDAYNNVKDDWDAVSKSTATWSAAQKDAVKSAADGLKKTWDNLPADATGAEAAAQLKPQAQKLDSAVKSARTGLKCPG
ncbi:hypothetical protein PL81_21730 [Streptomyces sp. RSD-27]|nr:hypothetical protein PL81_21730 [Streptomyces sp. RSD-27]